MKRFLILLAVLLLATLICQTAAAESTYYIKVDITNQYVTVYRSSDDVIVRQMICSTGKPATPTPLGTYYMPPTSRSTERQKWYTFADCYAQYASRIRGGYLFHSYLFSRKSDSAVIRSSVSALGSQASHGCVRMRIADAKWIAKNALAGTKVKIYYSGKRDNGIRALLLKGSYSINSGKSYEEWSGKGQKGELGRGDSGAKVKQLQQRLVGMGYAKMSCDGEYGQNTIDAVKRFQSAVGINATGVTGDDTWDALFKDDAPVGKIEATLYKGVNGTLVKNLQNTLTTLKFYSGDIDGDFDDEVETAVNTFRRIHGYKESGKMGKTALDDAEAKAAELIERFGDKEYKLVYRDYDVYMAKVNKLKKYTYMRKKASTSAKKVVRLYKGTELQVLENGDKWTKVKKGDDSGFVQTKLLKFYTVTKQKAEYELVDAPVTPEPSVTPLPTVKPEPSATPEPSASTEPSATPEPSASTEPSATPEPSASTEPSATPEPSASTEPSATPEPSASTEPSATPEPSATAEPSSTPEP